MQGKEMDALMLIGEASAVLILAAAAYIMSLKDKVSLEKKKEFAEDKSCLLYTSPSPRDS